MFTHLTKSNPNVLYSQCSVDQSTHAPSTTKYTCNPLHFTSSQPPQESSHQHYCTWRALHDLHLERHTGIRGPAASHRHLNPQHSDAHHYVRTRPYVYLHYKHIACTTCPIPLMMIPTSQIPATRRGCRSRDLKISGRRRARRKFERPAATWLR